MDIEKLKEVKVEDLTKEEILNHIDDVLSLEKEELIVEYLTYAIDNFYNLDDNPENVELFFKSEKFKPYYEIMLSKNTE